jgi:hypothetical protein
VPSKASGGAKASSDDPTNEAAATSAATEPAETATASTTNDSGSLPFTGSTMLPVLVLALGFVVAGAGLRRVARVKT